MNPYKDLLTKYLNWCVDNSSNNYYQYVSMKENISVATNAVITQNDLDVYYASLDYAPIDNLLENFQNEWSQVNLPPGIVLRKREKSGSATYTLIGDNRSGTVKSGCTYCADAWVDELTNSDYDGWAWAFRRQS